MSSASARRAICKVTVGIKTDLISMKSELIVYAKTKYDAEKTYTFTTLERALEMYVILTEEGLMSLP